MFKLISGLIVLFAFSPLCFGAGKQVEVRMILSAREASAVPHEKFEYVIEQNRSPEELLVSNEVLLSNSDFRAVEIKPPAEAGPAGVPVYPVRPLITITLSEDGRNKLLKVTSGNIGKRIAIVSDGEVLSAPMIVRAVSAGFLQMECWKIDTDDKAIRFVRDLGFEPILTTLQAPDAQQIPARTEMGVLAAELVGISPISDHFPAAPGQPQGPRTYLLAKLKLMNRSNQPLEVEIVESSISFDKWDRVRPGKVVSIMNENGVATGWTVMAVTPGEHIFDLRGDGVFDGMHDGHPLYLTLTLSSQQGTMTIRNSGSVGKVD